MVEIFLAVEKIFSCTQEEEKGKEREERYREMKTEHCGGERREESAQGIGGKVV